MNHASAQHNKSRRIKSILGVIGVIAIGAIMITALNVLKSTPEPKPELIPPAAKVQTLTINTKTTQVRVSSQGSVMPQTRIQLIAEVSGRIVSVSRDYANGGFFSKGEALLSIDQRDYQTALAQARSEVASAEERYALEKGRARQAKREWRDLGNQEANDLFLRKPQLAAARASVEAALANKQRAQINLERTAITSPFNGRIQTIHVDIGQYVTQGTVIADVYSTDAALVRLPLTDKQVGKVALPLHDNVPETDLPDVVISSVYGGKHYQWRGKIVRTEASLDQKSRVTYAVAEIKAPYKNTSDNFRPPLTIGTYVSAEILGVKMEQLAEIPRKVIVKQSQVTVVDSNNEIQFKPIDIIQNHGEQVLVGGLNSGDKLLLTKVPFVVAGLKVDPQPAKALAKSSPTATPSSNEG